MRKLPPCGPGPPGPPDCPPPLIGVVGGRGIAASVAATLARIATAIASSTRHPSSMLVAPPASCSVCGRLEAAVAARAVEQLHPLIEVGHLRVQDIESNRLSASIKGGYQRVVVKVEAGQDEGDELVVFYGPAGGRKLVGERPHPGEVDGNRLIALLRTGEGGVKIVDAGVGL